MVAGVVYCSVDSDDAHLTSRGRKPAPKKRAAANDDESWYGRVYGGRECWGDRRVACRYLWGFLIFIITIVFVIGFLFAISLSSLADIPQLLNVSLRQPLVL
jgi:hypothetical protein